MIICNQVLANTPMHKVPLGQAQYTAPGIFGYGAQMKRLDTGKKQNRHPSDVVDRSHGSPLDKGESNSHPVVLVEEQQPDSTTRPDV